MEENLMQEITADCGLDWDPRLASLITAVVKVERRRAINKVMRELDHSGQAYAIAYAINPLLNPISP